MRTPTLEPYAIAAAQSCLSDRGDLWISGNDFVYFVEGVYLPTVADADGVLWSRETGIGLRPEGELLRFLHPATGAPVPTRDELAAQLQRQSDRTVWERERAETERARADALEAELVRLREAQGE